MTIFGAIWLFIIIVAFFIKDIRYMIGVTLIAMLWQCNDMISLDTLSCGPQIITSGLFIIKSLKYRKDYKEISRIKLKEVYLSLVVFLCYLVFNVFFIDRSVTMNKVLALLQIFIYILAFYRMKVVSRYIDEHFFDKCIRIIAIIIIIVGVLQLLVVALNIPRNSIIQTLLYNDTNNANNIYYFKSSVRFYSTFMEPSFVAGLIVGLIVYFFSNKKNRKKYDVFLIISLLVALILTFSSTAYGTFLIVTSIYAMRNIKKKSTWMYIFLGLILLIGLAVTTDVLNQVIFEKGATSSGRVRSQWNTRAFEAFLNSPTFGTGYKSLRASSIALDILGELGIIGLLLYIKSIWSVIKYCFSKKSNFINNVAANFVLAMLISQVIGCPDIDLCSFWLAMYIFALATNINVSKNIENT